MGSGFFFAVFVAEPNIFLRICTHAHTITISNDLCSPIALPVPTHAIQIAPMYSKIV